MILGLDVSTSCTGYTILGKDGKLIESSFIRLGKTKKLKDNYDKLAKVKQELEKIKKKHKIEKIFIEKALNKFRKGFSTPKIIGTCMWFNGAVCTLCYEVFNLKPKLLPFVTARRICGVKKGKDDDVKQCVMQLVLDTEPGFAVTYTHKGNISPGYYDAADSYIIARAGWYGKRKSNQSGSKPKRKTKRK